MLNQFFNMYIITMVTSILHLHSPILLVKILVNELKEIIKCVIGQNFNVKNMDFINVKWILNDKNEPILLH
jgi:hypothetical protein